MIAVTSENEVFSWGRNEDGCLGLGDVKGDHGDNSKSSIVISSPQKVPCFTSKAKDKARKGSKAGQNESMKAAVCGHKCSALITVDGDLYVAGRNRGTRLTFASDIVSLNKFTKASKANEGQVDDVVFGPYHSVVLTNQRTVITQYGPDENQKSTIKLTPESGRVQAGQDRDLEQRRFTVHHLDTSSNKEKSNFAVVAASDASGKYHLFFWEIGTSKNVKPELISLQNGESNPGAENSGLSENSSPTNVISLCAGNQQIFCTYSLS